MLWTLRYRRSVAGVTTTLIEASSFALAEQVGRRWCGETPGAKYITVEQAIVATEAILGTPVVTEVVRDTGPKPSLQEQRERQKERTEVANATGRIAPALQSDGVAVGASSDTAATPDSDEPMPNGIAATSASTTGRPRSGRVGQ